MFAQTLPQPDQSLLEKLGRKKWMRNFCLVGGIGAASRLGHRILEGLNLSTQSDLNKSATIQGLKRLGEFEPQTEAWGAVTSVLYGVPLTPFTRAYRIFERLENLWVLMLLARLTSA